MKAKHTPTPWKVKRDDYGNGYCFILSCDGEAIGTMREIILGEKVVKAVNNHDDLLEACNLAADYLSISEDNGSEIKDLINKLEKAIKQAEGK